MRVHLLGISAYGIRFAELLFLSCPTLLTVLKGVVLPSFFQFLAIAKGSAGEIEAQLYVALDQKYINEEQFTST
jgi:hypothetical protein